MRLVFLYISILASSISSFGQNSSPLKFENTPLQEVFIVLESRYDVVFSYTADLTEKHIVNVTLKNQTLNSILDQILKPARLTYKILDNGYIVISRAELTEIQLCATFLNEEGEALSYVNVFLPEVAIGTSSNENGVLDWTQQLLGNERVEVSYIGYENHLTTVNALQSCPNVVLKTQQFSFEEVVVKEYVVSGIEQSSEMDHMVMRPDKIDMVPGLTDADVLQLIQLLPGVQSIDESATGLHIRGGTPDQNLILYDGIPIYNGGHFFGMISAFNPSLVDNVDVYRSGFGPNYGGRVSGVIDIQSINQIPERIQADAGVNFTHGDVSMAVPLFNQKVGLVFGARKSYTNIVETPTYRKLSERVFRKGKLEEINEEDPEDPEVLDFNLAFDFHDYNGKLLFEPTEKDNLSFSYFQIDDNLNFNYSEFEDNFATNDRIDQSSSGWGAQWERRWNSRFVSSINFSSTEFTNTYEFRLRDGDLQDLELDHRQSNIIDDKTLVWDNEWKLNHHVGLNFGGQFSDLNVMRSWQEDQDVMDQNREIDNNKIATGYLSLHTQFAEKLKSKIGLRWNHANATQENYFEPRFDIQYLPFKSFQIRSSAGFYRQFMSQVIEFNDLGINQDFWVLSDEKEDIPVTLGKNFTLGMLFYPRSFMLEIEGYYKKISGLVSNLSAFNIDEDEIFESGAGTSWGIDVLLKKRWNKFQSWMSYSYSRSRYTVELENDDLEFNAPHDRPHSLLLMGKYQSNRWNVSLSWRLASGIVFTEVDELSVVDDPEEEEPEPVYELNRINMYRLPISHRLDMSIMYDVVKKNGMTGKIGFSLLNMYNRENIMSREYFAVFDEEIDQDELQARDRAMLRFTPNIVVRIGFQ
ncbi:MAG: TonB-dependent receptor [Bacteroidota bacterium]